MKPNSGNPDRAAINRQNAALSSGPKTAAGKARSAQNSLRHGLYSKALILPFENAAEFEQLRNALIAEHQPAGATEMLLVDEIAQSAWRIRRFRLLEQATLAANDLDLPLFTLFQRALASAERAFHRALAALARLKKDSGFVPANRASQDNADTVTTPESRFEARSQAIEAKSEAIQEMSEANSLAATKSSDPLTNDLPTASRDPQSAADRVQTAHIPDRSLRAKRAE